MCRAPSVPPVPIVNRPRASRLPRWLGRPGFHVFLTGLLMVLGFMLAHRLSERSGRDQLSALSTERLELYASNLAAELGRHASLPSLLAIAPTLQTLMQAPGDEAARRAASQMMARVNVRAGTHQIFVATPQGEVLAAPDQATQDEITREIQAAHAALDAREAAQAPRGVVEEFGELRRPELKKSLSRTRTDLVG